MAQADSYRVAPANAPVVVVDGFLPDHLAAAMRRDLEAHFADPGLHRAETHQVWNYWFVPDLYTYLRTTPERVIGREYVVAFHDALREWSTLQLGLVEVTWPFLSLYVDGCRQSWHNDSRNGRFGFVYSLTRDQRRTIGGETLVMREGDPFRAHLANATAGRGLYDVIEPRFNRLLIFDDRLPHAVERIAGSMDPIEGRFVLHGHLREGAPVVAGALAAAAIAGPLNQCLSRFAEEMSASTALYHGPLTLRLTIDAAGTVAGCDVLIDRVIHPDAGHVEWDTLRERLLSRLKALKFEPSSGPTVLIQPALFGETAFGD